MLDGKQLRALFQQFNGQYFGGKLPAYSLRAAKELRIVEERFGEGERHKCYVMLRLLARRCSPWTAPFRD